MRVKKIMQVGIAVTGIMGPLSTWAEGDSPGVPPSTQGTDDAPPGSEFMVAPYDQGQGSGNAPGSSSTTPSAGSGRGEPVDSSYSGSGSGQSVGGSADASEDAQQQRSEDEQHQSWTAP